MTMALRILPGILLVVLVIGIIYWQSGMAGPVMAELGNMTRGFNPDFAAFARAPLLVQIHAASAMLALALGAVQLIAPKGTLPHRTLGYIWVALMLIIATTAIFIREINNGDFSFIHIFVPLTFFGLFGMVANARAMRTDKHRNAVLGLFFGALLIPGLFSFMPGRLMWHMFFGG